MENPWLIAGSTVAVFLLVSILGRIIVWIRELRQWRVVCSWQHDGKFSPSTRVRFPAPGYQVLRRGDRFRAIREDAYGSVIDRFPVQDHMAQAVQDCWEDWERRTAITSDGTGTLGSRLPSDDGSLYTA